MLNTSQEDQIFRRRYYHCLLMTLVIFLLLSGLPWQYKYPISGVLTLSPRNLVLKARHVGILQTLLVKSGQDVQAGQILMRMQSQQSLEFSLYYREKMKHIKQKILKIKLQEQDIRQQLLKLKRLVAQRIVTQDNYQQVVARLRQLQIQEQDAVAEQVELAHLQFSPIQAPVAGRIIDLRVKPQDILSKHQDLLIIQPKMQTWMVKFFLPVKDFNKVFVGAKLRLSTPMQTRWRRYQIPATVTYISPLVKQQHGHSYLTVFAKILVMHHSFLPNLPIEGMILGDHHAWFYWFWQWIKMN